MADITEPETFNLPFSWLLAIFQNTIASWRKNFTKLTLILVLPALSFIFLAELQALEGFYSNITGHRIMIIELNFTQGSATDKPIQVLEHWNDHETWDWFSSEKWLFFGIFKSFCYLPFLGLSPLPVAAAVYYVAVTNANQEFTSKEVAAVTFNVWKRLLTFSCTGYVAILSLITVIAVVFTCLAQALASIALAGFLGRLYQAGLVYLCLIWQMTTVISVLDEAYNSIGDSTCHGTTKLLKYDEIVEEKMWAKAIVLFNLIFLRVIANISFGFHGMMMSVNSLLSISLFSLFALVIQIVMSYFSKLYHLENLQWWCSMFGEDQRESFLEEPVPIMGVGA